MNPAVCHRHLPKRPAPRSPVGLRASVEKLDAKAFGASGPRNFAVREPLPRAARDGASRLRRRFPMKTFSSAARLAHRPTAHGQSLTARPPCDPLRARRPRVHRIAGPRIVTFARRPSYWGRDAQEEITISGITKEQYFSATDWTAQISLSGRAKFDFARTPAFGDRQAPMPRPGADFARRANRWHQPFLVGSVPPR